MKYTVEISREKLNNRLASIAKQRREFEQKKERKNLLWSELKERVKMTDAEFNSLMERAKKGI